MLKNKLLILSILPHFCFAMSVTDFFFNENQQGANLLKQHKNASAAAKFQDKNWKGVAYYRDKQFDKAYDEFKLDNSAQGLYNQGNALAKLEKYDEAINAYSKALELQKDFPDAKFNKELLEKLKQQQNSDNNKSDNQKDNSDKNDKSDNKSNKDQSNSKKDKSDKSDKQNTKDQSKDSKNSDKSNNAKDNKQQDKSEAKDKAEQKADAQKMNKQETKPEGSDAKQQAEEKEAKPGNSNEVPTQVENEEVKSALSQVPDDPGGLLRNKFIRDYQSGQDND